MNSSRSPRFWSGPSLALQIMLLLLGGLVVAQLVTLALTWLLPPEPQAKYELGDIARVLAAAQASDGPFQRVIQDGPPEPTGPGWLTSERSRHDLAMLLARDDADVRLFFYTPLPFAGATATMPRDGPPPAAEPAPAQPPPRKRRIAYGDDAPVRIMYADYQMAQASPRGGPPGGGSPGGSPGGPGGNDASGRPNGFGGPGGTGPRDQTGSGSRDPDAAVGNGPSGADASGTRGPGAGRTGAVPRASATPSAGGFSSPSSGDRPGRAMPPQSDGNLNTVRPSDVPGASSTPSMNRVMPSMPIGGGAPVSAPILPDATTSDSVRASPSTRPDLREPRGEFVEPPRTAPPPQAAAPAGPTTATTPRKGDTPSTPRRTPLPVARDDERAVAVAPTRGGLFGFAPAPFVEGDFVAALRLAGGSWAVVQPVPEPFPNAWQRRVLLWFALAALLVAPLGWLFSRRLVRPISGFAAAAEQLGRDPTAAILPLDGPAEVGRAAHAFNRMQNRLRSFVDDRTAMIGAISHDLRTPLTRMRFRIEDAPDDVRDGMLHEVEEMEAMITSVLAFIRDASEPGSRERLDLSSIVEDVVEDAVFVGKDVRLARYEAAPVEVDAIGMRRLLTNLVENAVKYGDRAEVRLFTDRNDAVTEVSDDGPGLSDDELERVFQPFYRTASARASDKSGSGLGLAVCRSIARAHGGDVQLMRGRQGLIAQVRLPLAYAA